MGRGGVEVLLYGEGSHGEVNEKFAIDSSWSTTSAHRQTVLHGHRYVALGKVEVSSVKGAPAV